MTKDTINYVEQIKEEKRKKLIQKAKYYAVGIGGGIIGAGIVVTLGYLAGHLQQALLTI